LFADPQVGVHGALGIRGHQHQALAGDARGQAIGTIVGDPGGGQIAQVEMPVVVVGHPARVVAAAAEAAQRDHGVGARAAAGAPGQRQVVAEGVEQLLLAGCVDQGHHPLFDAVRAELGVGDAQFGIH
jgi:hypothetical protein